MTTAALSSANTQLSNHFHSMDQHKEPELDHSDTSCMSRASLSTPEFKNANVNFDSLPSAALSMIPEPPASGNTWAPTPQPPQISITDSNARSRLPKVSPAHGQRRRDMVMQKTGNWRKKYATLIGPNASPPPPNDGGSHNNYDGPESGPSDSSHHSNDSMGRPAHSSTTGCYISAPISPPIGYPMPQTATAKPLQHPPAEDPRASVISSSSSGSSRAGSTKGTNMPPPPGWAQPPAKPAPRASSFDTGLGRPGAYFNPERMQGPAGEWVEVLKGEQGRIAIKSTPTEYEVMVWLPGFSINDITIVTRRGQVLHIVADQWDENDHAQWEIKLGDDAIMTSVRAAFTGQELKITVRRNVHIQPSTQSIRSNVSMRTTSTRAGPSFAKTMGHERRFSSPSAVWSDKGNTDQHDIEARLNRGAMGGIGSLGGLGMEPMSMDTM